MNLSLVCANVPSNALAWVLSCSALRQFFFVDSVAAIVHRLSPRNARSALSLLSLVEALNHCL